MSCNGFGHVARCLAGKPAVLLGKASSLVDRHEHGEVFALSQLEVLSTTTGCNMHDTCALVVRDVVPSNDAMGDLGLRCEVIERSAIRPSDQRAAERGACYIGAGSKQVFHTRRHHPVDALRCFHCGIFGGRVDRGRDVGGQRPRGGRPDHDRLIELIDKRKTHMQRGVCAIAVRVDQLVLRERRATAGAPDHWTISPIQHLALVTDFQELPDRSDIRVRHRVIRPVPIHPLTEPLRLSRLDRGVFGHAVAAGASKLVEPVLLDLLLRVEAERLLDLYLDPEPLAVESILVALFVSEHGAVPLHQIFQRATPCVMHTHWVIGGDWAINKRKWGAARVLCTQSLKGGLLLPQREHAVLKRNVVRSSGYGVVGTQVHQGDSTESNSNGESRLGLRTTRTDAIASRLIVAP